MLDSTLDPPERGVKLRGMQSLFRNASYGLSGHVVYLVSQWSILVLLARLTTPEIVGEYGLATALTAPLVMLGQLGMRDLYSTDPDQSTFGYYLGVRVGSIALLFAALVAIGAIGGYSPGFHLVLFAVGAVKGVESLSDLWYGAMQREERLDIVGRSLAIRGVVSLVSGSTALAFTRSLAPTLMAMAAGLAIVAWYYDAARGRDLIGNAKWTKPRWSRDVTPRMIAVALPLGGVGLITALHTGFGRYLLGFLSDRASIGYFTAIASSLAALDMVNTALRKAAIGRMGKEYRVSRESFMRLLGWLCAFGALLGVAGALTGVLAGKQILAWIFGPAYAEYSSVLVVLLIGRIATTSGAYVKAAQVVIRQLRFQLTASVLSLAVGIPLGVWLVREYGVLGAAVAVATVQWIAFGLSATALLLAMRESDSDAVTSR